MADNQNIDETVGNNNDADDNVNISKNIVDAAMTTSDLQAGASNQKKEVSQKERNIQNNENNIRNAADVAIATGNPYAMAAGVAFKKADKISGGRITNHMAKNMNRSNMPGSHSIQRTSNFLSDSGLGDKIGKAAAVKNAMSANGASGSGDSADSNKIDLNDSLLKKKSDDKEKGKVDATEDEKANLFGKIPLSVKLIIAGVVIFFTFVIIFITVIFTSVGSVLNWFKGSSSSTVVNYNHNASTIKDNCANGIMVDDQVYDLDDYVAGVVSFEADSNRNIESLKAIAIASRTYAIVKTNGCQKSISSNDANQTFNSNFTDVAKQAVQQTKGLVLTYNSDLFLSEYDSFYDGGDYKCSSDGSCSVTYAKLPNNETHIVTISGSYLNLDLGGHGRGMSKAASYEMAASGKNYKEILEYFYSSGVSISDFNDISTYNGGVSADATGFSKRTVVPEQGNEHDNNYYYSNNNVSFASGFVGECTWYAFGRANEILDSVGSNLKWNYANHARTWYSYNLGLGSNGFSSSSNVKNPKVGAIIVWTSDKFGHVAIVEAVNADGTIDYSESNVTSAKSSSNKYGFRYQSHISYVGTGVGTISNIWSGYNFVGYIYMIE